jgi:hypothetical protein
MTDNHEHPNLKMIVVADPPNQIATLDLIGDDGHGAKRVVTLTELDQIINLLVHTHKLLVDHKRKD